MNDISLLQSFHIVGTISQQLGHYDLHFMFCSIIITIHLLIHVKDSESCILLYILMTVETNIFSINMNLVSP